MPTVRFSIVQMIPNQDVGNEPSHGQRGGTDHAGKHDVIAQFLVREKGVLNDFHDIGKRILDSGFSCVFG